MRKVSLEHLPDWHHPYHPDAVIPLLLSTCPKDRSMCDALDVLCPDVVARMSRGGCQDILKQHAACYACLLIVACDQLSPGTTLFPLAQCELPLDHL